MVARPQNATAMNESSKSGTFSPSLVEGYRLSISIHLKYDRVEHGRYHWATSVVHLRNLFNDMIRIYRLASGAKLDSSRTVLTAIPQSFLDVPLYTQTLVSNR